MNLAQYNMRIVTQLTQILRLRQCNFSFFFQFPQPSFVSNIVVIKKLTLVLVTK